MPSKRILIAAGAFVRLVGVDKRRKVIVISNYFTTPGYVVQVFDSKPFRTDLQNFRIPPTSDPNVEGASSLTLTKADGDDTEAAWYGYSVNSLFVVVHEGF